MGLVLQTQRRGLEAFKPHATQAWPPEAMSQKNARFSLGLDNGSWPTALLCLGVSEGIGTCSDLKGVAIAVLGYQMGNDKRQEDFKLDWERLAVCQFATLLWPQGVRLQEVPNPESGELRRVNTVKVNPLQIHQTVELLEFSSFKEWNFGKEKFTSVHLLRTGLLNSYIPI